MGVLTKSASGYLKTGSAELGVAVLAELIAEGKLEVTGVASFSSFGLAEGMVAVMTKKRFPKIDRRPKMAVVRRRGVPRESEARWERKAKY